MLALVSHFKSSFRAPFPPYIAGDRDMPLVEKTMRAHSDMAALHAAAQDMNVGKGALCWMLSELLAGVDWKTLQQRVILAGDCKCLEDMIDTYFEKTASMALRRDAPIHGVGRQIRGSSRPCPTHSCSTAPRCHAPQSPHGRAASHAGKEVPARERPKPDRHCDRLPPA